MKPIFELTNQHFRIWLVFLSRKAHKGEEKNFTNKNKKNNVNLTSSHFMNFSPLTRLCGTSTGFKRAIWAGTLGADIFHSSNSHRNAKTVTFSPIKTVHNRCTLKGYHRYRTQNKTPFPTRHFTWDYGEIALFEIEVTDGTISLHSNCNT